MENEKQTEVNTTHCLNCGTEFEGNFCPECGQSADTGRFTIKLIFENLQTAVLGKDGGVWFTLKSLFTRPGAMIVDILGGKRKRYFSPFPMLFLTLTVYILLLSITGSREYTKDLENISVETSETAKSDTIVSLTELEKTELEKKESAKKESRDRLVKYVGAAFRFYNNHYTTVFILTLPLFLFATRAWYGKKNRKRYYQAEYLVAIVYSMVMVVLFRCLVSLVYLFSASASDTISNFAPLVIVAAFTACFKKMLGFSIAKTAWRSLLALVLYYIILGILLLSIFLILAVFAFFIVKR